MVGGRGMAGGSGPVMQQGDRGVPSARWVSVRAFAGGEGGLPSVFHLIFLLNETLPCRQSPYNVLENRDRMCASTQET